MIISKNAETERSDKKEERLSKLTKNATAFLEHEVFVVGL